MSLDYNGWIDQQRAAGQARGNIFQDIMKAAALRRAGSARPARESRSQDIRQSAQLWDKLVEREANRGK